jgi:hypothetical protein
MTSKFKQEDVIKFFETNGYILPNDFKYKNGYTLIDFEDRYGYKYSSYYECILPTIERGGKPLFVYFKNPYSIYNISKWIEINHKKFLILSEEYISSDKHLNFKCNVCKKEFQRTWAQLNVLNLGCPFCENTKYPAHGEFSEKDILEIIEKYVSGIRIMALCREYHCRNTTIAEILQKNNIKIKKTYEYYTSKELARTRKYYCNEDVFENIDSHDKAYWLGFMFADGNVHVPKGKETSSKGIRIEISLKEEDYYHLHNFSGFLESNYPVKPKIVKLNGKEILVYRISIGSVKMGKDLISHGCVPNKSLILEYPKDLLEEYFPSFLCGYFDGDGCLSFIKHGRILSSNQLSLMGTISFLQIVKEKLFDIGIETGAIYKAGKDNKAYVLPIRANSHASFFNLIYHKASYMLGRKFDKFMDMLDYRGKDFEMSEVAKLARYIL